MSRHEYASEIAFVDREWHRVSRSRKYSENPVWDSTWRFVARWRHTATTRSIIK